MTYALDDLDCLVNETIHMSGASHQIASRNLELLTACHVPWKTLLGSWCTLQHCLRCKFYLKTQKHALADPVR